MKTIILRKPRKDSHLKTLPEQKQAEIIEYLRSNTYPDTVKWLAGSGISTSHNALSRFWKDWHLRQQLEHNESTVSQVMKDLKNTADFSEKELLQAGHKYFSVMAIAEEDSLTWKRAQDALSRREMTQLHRDKYEFDAVEACMAKLPDLQYVRSNRKLTEEEKQAAIHRILFPEEQLQHT